MSNLQTLAKTICESKRPWTSSEIAKCFGYSPQYSCLLMRQLEYLDDYVCTVEKQHGKRTVTVYNCLGDKPLNKQEQLYRLVVFGTPLRLRAMAYQS